MVEEEKKSSVDQASQEVKNAPVPWKWAKVKVTSSEEGTFDGVNLFKPVTKAHYFSPNYPWQYGDSFTYVDMATKKLWSLANPICYGTMKPEEFNQEVLRLGIESGIVVEDEPSTTLICIEWLKNHLVEWFVAADS